MSEASSPQLLFDDVSARLQAELTRASEKTVMREANLPRSIVNRGRSGEAPKRSTNLIWTLSRLVRARGVDAGLRVLEPVLGKFDDRSIACRLDAIFAEVGELRDAIQPSAVMAPRPDRLLGALGGGREGAASAAGREGGSPVPRLAPTATRRDLWAGEGIAGHLGRHLEHWRERAGSGTAAELAAFAEQRPADRVGITVEAEGALVFGHLNPAFYLYSDDDRARLIGKPTVAGPDRDYAEFCNRSIRGALDTGQPVLEDVDATVSVGPGARLRLIYTRLILPFLDGNRRLALCASEMGAPA